MGNLSLKKIPEIKTPNLILREIGKGDASSYYSLYSDLDVMRGWGTLPHASINETTNLIGQLEIGFQKQEQIRWGIIWHDELVGDTGFWRIVNVRNRGEIGVKLKKAFWKRGIMSEALCATIEFGFKHMGFNSIEGNIDPSNEPSLKLFEKIGFVREGYIREHTYNPFIKSYCDTILFSLLKKNWKGFPIKCDPLPL